MHVQAVAEAPAERSSRTGPRGRLALRKVWRNSQATVAGASALLLVVLLWQMTVSFGIVNRLFLPPPGEVFKAMFDLLKSGEFWYHIGVSSEEFGYGLAISILIGAFLGIITGWYSLAEQFFRPIVTGLNSMPHVAVIPVLILLFGIGLAPKIVIIVLSCAVTILLNTAAGVQNVDKDLMKMARSFGASDFQAIRVIVLPSVVPYFMTGVRISVGRALIAVVVSEFFASKAGVGNVMISAANSFNMPKMYATLFIITGLGIALTQGASLLEERMQKWKN